MTTAPSVVVGTDGSASNRAAVDYAAHEAAATDRHLHLVTAVDEEGWLQSDRPITAEAEKMLEEIRQRVVEDDPDVALEVRMRLGHAVGVLLHQTGPEDVLVVGKRGLGAVRRMLVGSNSIRVAARAEAPVIVVPPEWSPAERATAPIIVGIDPEHDHDASLAFAFERAERQGAALHVVHAVDLELVMVVGGAAVSSADLHDWEVRSSAAIEAAVKPFREAHPDVAVEVVKDRGHAADFLLGQAEDAQLVVLGRRHRGPAAWGLGSVAREVLHAADVPVAIVPTTKH